MKMARLGQKMQRLGQGTGEPGSLKKMSDDEIDRMNKKEMVRMNEQEEMVRKFHPVQEKHCPKLDVPYSPSFGQFSVNNNIMNQ